MSVQTPPVADGTQDVSNDEAASTELDVDEIFHLLQNARRRRVFRYLFEHEGDEEFEMRDIAEQVAAWENDKPVQAITSSERQRAYISLYQCHLPKLDEKGVIEYNQSRGYVRQTAAAEQFRSYVDTEADEVEDAADDACETTAPSSSRYYSGATVVSLLLTGASWLGMFPAVLSTYLSVFITGLFALVTVGAMRSRRL